jgi:hypothetical protein
MRGCKINLVTMIKMKVNDNDCSRLNWLNLNEDVPVNRNSITKRKKDREEKNKPVMNCDFANAI